MKRLLVVEDHPWVSRAICAKLAAPGTRVVRAENLEEARARIRRDASYDAVICEQHLADGSGLELLGWLRWHLRIPTPFLLIARDDLFVSTHERELELPARTPDSAGLLLRLQRLLNSERAGILAGQIPFAGEAA